MTGSHRSPYRPVPFRQGLLVCLLAGICLAAIPKAHPEAAEKALPIQESEPAAVSPARSEPDILPASRPMSVTEEKEAIRLHPTLFEPDWEPEFARDSGLRLWDCIVLALENNRPLMNSREDLRSALVTLRERREEFGNIYNLGAGAHYDNNGAPAPIARSDAGVNRDRFSFTFGGREGDGTVVSRQFPGGGTLSLGAQSIYSSQTATRLRPFLDNQGDLVFLPYLQDVRWFSEANVALTQPLLEGAGDVATTGLRIQQLESAARRLGLERQIQTVISQAVRDYLQVQLQVSLAEIQQQAYRLSVDFYKEAIIWDREYITRYRGRAPIQGPVSEEERSKGKDPLEKVRSEQQITSTKQRFLDTRNGVETSSIDLRLTLGLEPGRAIVLAGTEIPQVVPPGFSIEEAIDLGLQARPDYRVAEIAVKQADLNLRAAENALLPNLDLSWRMAFREQDDDYLESWESFAYEDAGADLTLALPLNLPADRANHERSAILSRQVRNDLDQIERVVVNEIDEAYRAQETLLARIEVLRRNEQLARKTYETLLGRGQRGLDISPFDVAQAQDEWTAASSERVRAEINYVIATAVLDLAMGRPIGELLMRYAPPPGEPMPSP